MCKTMLSSVSIKQTDKLVNKFEIQPNKVKMYSLLEEKNLPCILCSNSKISLKILFCYALSP